MKVGEGQWRRSVAEFGGGGRWRSVVEVEWWRSVEVEVGGGGRWRSVAEVRGGQWRRSVEVGGGGRRRRSRAEVEECGVRCASLARVVLIPVFISLFSFIFFQCLNSRLIYLHMFCISDLIVVLFSDFVAVELNC